MTDSRDVNDSEVHDDGTVDVAVSARLRRWIEHEFAPEVAAAVLAELRATPPAAYGGQNHERIHAAHVLDTDGEWNVFQSRRELARLDWRDLLMVGGLGEGGWEERLDEWLGSPSGGDTMPTSNGEQGGRADDQQGER